MLQDSMRNNQTFVLEIENWNEGTGFVPALKRKRAKSKIQEANSIDFGEERVILRKLKPVGYYVAYSYNFFRTGEGPHDSLYRFF